MTGHFNPAGSAHLVITFNPTPMGLADKGFASDFVIDAGHDHVFVAEGANSYYQFLSQAEFGETLLPLIGNYDRVFLYGEKLGGYAALFYSAAAKGIALALAPQLPAHPEMQAFAKEAQQTMADTVILHPDMATVADHSQAPIVLHDPRHEGQDYFMARFVRPNWPKLHDVALPGAGQRITRLLAYQGLLAPMLTNLFDTGTMPDVTYDPAYRPQRHLAKAVEALQNGELNRAGRLLVMLSNAPETQGFDDARLAWEAATGQKLARKMRRTAMLK